MSVRSGIHVSTCLVSGTVRTGAIQNHRHCRERALLGIVPAMATAVLYFFAFVCSLQLGKVSIYVVSRYTAFVHRCLLSGFRSAPECELDKPVYILLVLTRSSVNAVYLQGLLAI